MDMSKVGQPPTPPHPHPHPQMAILIDIPGLGKKSSVALANCEKLVFQEMNHAFHKKRWMISSSPWESPG